MGGCVGARAGGEAGREMHGSRQIPGSRPVIKLVPSKTDAWLSWERAGVYLGIKAGELVYEIPHPKLQQTGNPLFREQRK